MIFMVLYPHIFAFFYFLCVCVTDRLKLGRQNSFYEAQNSITEGSSVWGFLACSAFHNWAGVICIFYYFFVVLEAWYEIWWRKALTWNDESGNSKINHKQMKTAMPGSGENLPLPKSSPPRQTSCTFYNGIAQLYIYSASSHNLRSLFMRPSLYFSLKMRPILADGVWVPGS